MIKMSYKQEPYNYEGIGGQNYKVGMEIEMVQDASLGDLFDATVRLAEAATYPVTIKALAQWLYDYACEHNQEKELNEFFGINLE